MSDRKKGLYNKFAVFRADEKGRPVGLSLRDVFVLCPRTDMAARSALRDYAGYLEFFKIDVDEGDMALVDDIYRWLEKLEEQTVSDTLSGDSTPRPASTRFSTRLRMIEERVHQLERESGKYYFPSEDQ